MPLIRQHQDLNAILEKESSGEGVVLVLGMPHVAPAVAAQCIIGAATLRPTAHLIMQCTISATKKDLARTLQQLQQLQY